jgi:hypothetical protein
MIGDEICEKLSESSLIILDGACWHGRNSAGLAERSLKAGNCVPLERNVALHRNVKLLRA